MAYSKADMCVSKSRRSKAACQVMCSQPVLTGTRTRKLTVHTHRGCNKTPSVCESQHSPIQLPWGPCLTVRLPQPA
jgi:hypothetical protein